MKGSLEEIDVQSAKNKLILSFRTLVRIKEFEKLTVAEICEHANVSRKTFYTHFKDKNDMIEQNVLRSITQPFKEMRRL